jgi:hypothetical protein
MVGQPVGGERSTIDPKDPLPNSSAFAIVDRVQPRIHQQTARPDQVTGVGQRILAGVARKTEGSEIGHDTGYRMLPV